MIWTPGWSSWKPLHEFLTSDQTYFVMAPAPQISDIPTPPNASEEDEKTVLIESTLATTETKLPSIPEDEEHYTEVFLDTNPTAGHKRVDYGYYYDDFHGDQIDPDASIRLPNFYPDKPYQKGKDANRRATPRHNFRIEVILISRSGKTFRTHSVNISLGGTLLEDAIPKDFINARFDMILANRFEKDMAKARLHFVGRVVGDYTNPRRLMFSEPDAHTLNKLKTLLRSYQDHQKKSPKKAG